jgi:hypothetical protein
VTATVPETVEPLPGDVIETLGGVVSETLGGLPAGAQLLEEATGAIAPRLS